MSGIGEAMAIAWDAHRGQVDKGGNPYITHPLSVAGRMKTENEIIVALLHDVVEDSEYSIEDIKKAGFSDEVINALKMLTHDDGRDYFEYVEDLKQDPIARNVKLADLWHNSQAERLGREPSEKDLRRLEKYGKAREILLAEDGGGK